MKTETANRIAIFFVIWIAAICVIFSITSCSTPSKGYNYNAHYSRNVKFKKNNENGHYMKCKKHK